MTDLVVGDNLLLLIRQNCVLLLVSCDNYLNTLLKISLGHIPPAFPHCSERCFINNIGKLGTGCSGRHTCNRCKVNALIQFHFSRMDFQDLFTAFQVRQLYRNTPVETARSCKRRVQGFRTVRRCQDDDAVVCLKSIHLCKELVQGLLSLVISSDSSVTFLSDRINLIDKYNTRRFLLRLFEKITHFRRSHADKHFHKLGT